MSVREEMIRQGSIIEACAKSLDEVESARMAIQNRVGAAERAGRDSVAQALRDALEGPYNPSINDHTGLLSIEKGLQKNLEKAMKAHPLYPWVQREKGIGAKQAGRLLAAIGDPYWNELYDRPRKVSELISYAGYSVDNGVAVHREAGKKSPWSSDAKTRAFLMAKSCLKTPQGRYAALLKEARAHADEAVHNVDCSGCGTCGTCGGRLGKNRVEHLEATGCSKRINAKAAAGSPLSRGHAQSRALRFVAKQILKDIWAESRDLYAEEAAQSA